MIESTREDVEALAARSRGGDGEPGAPYRQHWFPVAFEIDLDPAALTRVTVFGKGYVLFRDATGSLACLPDRCPHRCARLSDGRLAEGRVECLYHGWVFEGAGSCTRIPQLGQGAAIPSRAHLTAVPAEVVQGIVWIWGGRPEDADPARITRIADLDRDDVRTIDYTTDLPYGQEALVENVLDFAHIHIAHDGARGGGHRDHAGPLAFEIEERERDGFRARFLSPSVDDGTSGSTTAGATVAFDAPNLVHYASTYEDDSMIAGLALFSVPLQHDRCRLVYRAYSNFWPQRDVDRPRWREHLHQMELLEQDMAVVMGQTAELAHESRSLRELWLPIKSSDQLVLQYRRWVEEFALETPGALGWRKRNDAEPTAEPARIDRRTLHTEQCGACRAALDSHLRWRSRAAWCAFGALVLAALAAGPARIGAAGLALAAALYAVACHRTTVELTRGPHRHGQGGEFPDSRQAEASAHR